MLSPYRRGVRAIQGKGKRSPSLADFALATMVILVLWALMLDTIEWWLVLSAPALACAWFVLWGRSAIKKAVFVVGCACALPETLGAEDL